jgi:hypothetical protein
MTSVRGRERARTKSQQERRVRGNISIGSVLENKGAI